MGANLGIDTVVTVLAAGLIFLTALALGAWKYRQMATSPDHLAHPYVDIAHRAALLYSFAALLVAVFVFVVAIASYVQHGLRRDTTNQFAEPARGLHAGMTALMAGEIGGFAVLLAGFVVAQLG